MPQLVYSFDVTVPAGTPASARWSQAINFPSADVSQIEIRVPPGPRGCLGFALGSSGTPVIPYNADQWIVTDDERIVWGVTDQFDSGAWEVFAYNTGTLPHTIYVRFLCDPTAGATATTVPAPIPLESLGG